MLLSELANEILGVAEKSAELARVIRSEEALFELLVEEKTGDSKNKRFVQDFKTLADVLVQEMVKHHLGAKFPGLSANIFGEESNSFTNALGETVEVSIQPTEQDTCALLETVLDGNQKAAGLLASVVHAEERATTVQTPQIPTREIPVDSIGIWIDPIDSTAQYILGKKSKESDVCEGVYEEGLQCAVILIGAYDIKTGHPFLGVVNQPFYHYSDETTSWSGRSVWGIIYEHIILHSDPPPPPSAPPTRRSSIFSKSSPQSTILMSNSEDPAIQAALKDDFNLLYAAGAGYKVLCVIDGLVDLYLLTKSSTFKWDTCSPHAILSAQNGGGLLDYSKAFDVVKSYKGVNEKDLAGLLKKECSVVYHKRDREDAEKGQEWSNQGGILAYKDLSVAVKMLKKLCTDKSLKN